MFIKVDLQRQRLYLKTATCNNFIHHQVEVLLNTECSDFRRFCLSLKDVSYGNFKKADEHFNLNALDEIGVFVQEPKTINYNFLSSKIRRKQQKYANLLSAGQNDCDEIYRRLFFIRPRRPWGTEKITAKLVSSMNDFRFLRMFVHYMYNYPNAKRTELDYRWDVINECLYDLLETEYKTLDPYFIRRETLRLYREWRCPFDYAFFEKVPHQKRFLKNKIVHNERIQYSKKPNL
jgi:hypothetical protein